MANELVEIQEKSQSVFSSNSEYQLTHKIATEISRSELVPDKYRGKPANCIIAIDIARQVRNSPLIVMQNLNIIKGKPAWSSTYISGVIHARFKNVKIETFGTDDEKGCKVIVIDSNGNVLEGAPVTIGIAKAEGWFSKKDSNGKEISKWQTMPDLMLQYRAMAFFGRVHCPDALIGLYSEFEAYDIAKQTHEDKHIENAFAKSQEKIPEQEVIEAEFSELKQTEPAAEEIIALICINCGVDIDQAVFNYSHNFYQRPLCRNCQKLAKEGQI